MNLGGCTSSVRVLRVGIPTLIILFIGTLLAFSSSARKSGETPKLSARLHVAKAPAQTSAPKPTPTPVIDAAPASSPTPAPAGKAIPSTANVQLAPAEPTFLLGDGTLTGRMLSSVPPQPVNLTTQGMLDWAHWGNGGATAFNHKNVGISQIGNFTSVNGGQIFSLNDNPTGFSWSDGTPTATVTNTHAGVFAIGLGKGFEFTIPADTNIKTLRIHVGLWRARGRLEATLSDGSAVPYLDTSLVNQSGTSNGLYTISFAAGSAGQTLTIRYTCETSFQTGSGNVTLEAATLVEGPDPDIRPVVGISSPSDEATINAGDTLALTANAFDTDGSISSVEFYVDGFLLGAGTLTGTNQYSLNWNSAFAGSHTLTAVATDNEGAKTTSEPISVTAIAVTGGALTGKMHSPSPPVAINLTMEGELDWAHWGNGGSQVFDHKASITSLISNAKIIGTSATSWFNDNPTQFSWTDGTPNTTATNTPTGIFVSSAGNGFEITVPADTTFKTVRVFTGLWSSQTRFEAALSDGSAPTFVDTSLGATSTTKNGIFALSYRAASNGQTLRIRYTILTDYNPPFGNITLEAVALSNGGPPSVTLTSPLDGTTVPEGQLTPLTATASDPSGIDNVQFFADGFPLAPITTPPYTTSMSSSSWTYSITAVATNGKGIPATSSAARLTFNAPPAVSAGYNQSITLPAAATLYGSVSDDGQPVSSTLTTTWSKVSGPGTVTFGNPNSAVTTASFSAEGDYVLRLTANDGAASVSSDVSVGVHGAITLALNTTADSHVRDGGMASTNFGTASLIEVQTGSTGDNRDAYFKFDLSAVGDINNAKLRIYAALSAAGSVGLSVYPASNITWTEAAINWNTRPPLGAPILSSVNVTDTAFAWYELDVTNYLV